MATLATMPNRSRMTSIGQPLPPTPMQAPPPQQIPQAPMAPQPTGPFQAPGPSLSAAGQFRIDQANKGAERSAAARGTLLSGGFQQSLAKLNQGLASQEYDNDFNRAAQTYGINRDTTQQNFGQSLAAFGAGRDAFHDTRAQAADQTNVLNANAQGQDQFAQMMEAFRAQQAAEQQAEVDRQNQAQSAMQRRPMGPSLGYRQPYVLR